MQRPPANQRAAPVANAERDRPISGVGAFFDGWALGDEEEKPPTRNRLLASKGDRRRPFEKHCKGTPASLRSLQSPVQPDSLDLFPPFFYDVYNKMRAGAASVRSWLRR